MPYISIITINLNNLHGLNKTIKSVISQSFKDYEFIVIDGASTDGSCDAVKMFPDHIHYFISEPDKGVYDAMNKGIKISKGKYLLFLNSGDSLINENVLTNFSHEKHVADIISGNLIVNYKNGKRENIKAIENLSFYHFYTHTIMHQSTFINRNLFENFGYYNTALRIVADWDFFIRTIFLHGASYSYSKYSITLFDPDGMSSDEKNKDICRMEREYILHKYFPYIIRDYIFFENNPAYQVIYKLKNRGLRSSILNFLFKILNKLLR